MPPADHFVLDAAWRLLLVDVGVELSDLFRRAQLPQYDLSRGPVHLPPAAFFRFWESLETLPGEHALPIRLARSLRGDAFSPVLFAALCSRSFSQAVGRIADYKALTGPLQLHSKTTDAGFVVVLRGNERCPTLPTSFGIAELLFLVSLARLATRTPILARRLTALTLPAHGEQYAEYLGTAVTVGAEFSLCLSRDDAERPFLTSDDALWTAFEPELRRRLLQSQQSPSMTERVRSTLLEALPTGTADIQHVSRLLAVSDRTLQRQLVSEGTTFQQLLRDVRASLATHYVERTSLAMHEIAFLLGFTHVTSFYRAFRDWTGTTPAGVRRLPSSRHDPA